MTQFLGTTSGSDGGIPFKADDVRLWPAFASPDLELLEVNTAGEWHLLGWTSPFWPGHSSLDASGDEWCQGFWYQRPELTNGAQSRYGIFGVTRDAYDAPLGGVTCKLFHTAPPLKDILIDETISDPYGNYMLSTPYLPDAHYVVTYKTGTPDVYGSSPNNLIGS